MGYTKKILNRMTNETSNIQTIKQMSKEDLIQLQ